MKKGYFLIGGFLATAGIILFLKNRRKIPKGVQVIKNFDSQKYLGRWYEIARLDFRFERGLHRTTAEYSLNKDGSIRVVNSGYRQETREQKTAVGRARFIGAETEARLEVSFWGPFYAGYNVIAIDPDYKYALVCGRSLKYLWLLSREKKMPGTVKDKYLDIAKSIGYNIDDLLWVKQED